MEDKNNTEIGDYQKGARNSNNLYNSDFDQTFASLSDKKICPFYYFMDMLKKSNPDIIICTYKDYFDIKSRIQISKLTSTAEYKLIFDESCEIDNIFTQIYSCNMDESLLIHSTNQLFLLKEKVEKKRIEANGMQVEDMSIITLTNGENHLDEANDIETEKEFLMYNELASFKMVDTFGKGKYIFNI
jgi:hypothetical protein